MTKLQSEKIVVSAPMSFTGSAQRIRRATGNFWLALPLIALAWVLVSGWYLIFGLLLVPYRLIRRNHRKIKKTELQHREMLEAVNKKAIP